MNNLKSLFKNRAVLGIACIVLALVLSFVVVPITEKFFSTTQLAFKAAEDIPKGTKITDNMISEVKVSGSYDAALLIDDKKDIVGSYAAMEMVKEDTVTTRKISKAQPFENAYLFNLPSGKQAISIALPSIELGLSGKLRSGDIVSVLAVIESGDRQKALAATQIKELQYVKVLAVQNGNSDDITDNTEALAKEKSEKVIDTVTLEVNSVQAQILAGLNQNASLHLTLAARKTEKENVQALLKQQEDFFEDYVPSAMFSSIQYLGSKEPAITKTTGEEDLTVGTEPTEVTAPIEAEKEE